MNRRDAIKAILALPFVASGAVPAIQISAADLALLKCWTFPKPRGPFKSLEEFTRAVMQDALSRNQVRWMEYTPH